MKHKKFRLLIITLILFFIALAPIVIFYARYEILTNHLEKNLGFDGGAANAVKHAYAAAELYSVLNAFLDDDEADSFVMSLGIINEYAERITKLRKPDSLREIMKDLHNNQVGIVAAKWQKQKSDKGNLLDTILILAQNKTLIVKRTENPLYKGEDQNGFKVVRIAREWLDSQHDEINERATLKLQFLDNP